MFGAVANLKFSIGPRVLTFSLLFLHCQCLFWKK